MLKDFAAQKIVNGRYDATYQGSSKASTYRHRGTIVTRTATGSLRGTRRYNEKRPARPERNDVCRTGTVRYSIRKIATRR